MCGSPGAASATWGISSKPRASHGLITYPPTSRHGKQGASETSTGLTAALIPPPEPVREPSPQVGFESPVGGMVIAPATESLGQVLLVHAGLGIVVGIPVAAAVAEILHESRRGIADVWRHRLRRPLGNV